MHSFKCGILNGVGRRVEGETRRMNASTDADVVIVGAGLAGASAAAVLARKGVRVMLIDSRQTYPACFKAEKIEPDQAQLLRKLGLMEGILPFATRINEVISARSGEVIRVLRLEQYGIFYQDIVSAVRGQIASTVTWKIGRVLDIVPGPAVSRLTLIGGETIAARLIVLACGTGGNLHAGLGIRKNMICAGQSFAIGFNISRENGQPFSFDALTYYPDGIATRIAFLTLFPIRDVMRANFFVYRSPGEEWVNRFKQEPHDDLMRALPELVRFTGPCRITGRVEMCPVDLYGVGRHIQPGLVLVGDAYQSVCPTTGTGLSKVLTDVDVLSECVPKWLRTPGMGNEKLSDYYTHSRKTACDTKSLRQAQYCRALSTNSSYCWQIHRELRYLGVRLLGWAKHSTTLSCRETEGRSIC
jgi:2-polyprenyl-6-methoxyphenol hydroxylase-like FAD-dependent oxidoreductase